MNIEQALERIAHLENNIYQMNDALFLLKSKKEVFMDVSVKGSCRHYPIYIDFSTLSEAIETMLEKNRAEITKLQPIVDVANAALKGVLS